MRLLSVGRRVDVTSVRFRPVIGIGDVDVERHAQIRPHFQNSDSFKFSFYLGIHRERGNHRFFYLQQSF